MNEEFPRGQEEEKKEEEKPDTEWCEQKGITEEEKGDELGKTEGEIETNIKRIYVGNLGKVTVEDLTQLFGLDTTAFLKRTCRVELSTTEETGEPKNHVFINVPEHIHSELIKLNGIEFYGQQLVIKEARELLESEKRSKGDDDKNDDQDEEKDDNKDDKEEDKDNCYLVEEKNDTLVADIPRMKAHCDDDVLSSCTGGRNPRELREEGSDKADDIEEIAEEVIGDKDIEVEAAGASEMSGEPQEYVKEEQTKRSEERSLKTQETKNETQPTNKTLKLLKNKKPTTKNPI